MFHQEEHPVFVLSPLLHFMFILWFVCIVLYLGFCCSEIIAERISAKALNEGSILMCVRMYVRTCVCTYVRVHHDLECRYLTCTCRAGPATSEMHRLGARLTVLRIPK